jgi:PadR family transcriptional regulator
MTLPTLLVLSALLADAGREMYGTEIMRATGLRSGSIIPIFRRLEDNGWVTSRLEAVNPAQAGRPRRRYYLLTLAGVDQGGAMLAAAQARFTGSVTSSGRQDDARAE